MVEESTETIFTVLKVEEFHLGAATRQYRAEAVTEHGIILSYPYKVVVPFEELTA